MALPSPYSIFEILLEEGKPQAIRKLAKRISSGNEKIDNVIVEIEKIIKDYHKRCEKIGEEPVISLDELNDQVTSSIIEEPHELLYEATTTILSANKAGISYYLRRMSWERFEDLCVEILKEMDVSDIRLTNRGPDRGVDFNGNWFNPMCKDIVIPVIGQAKHYASNNPVTVREVRELIAKLSTHRHPGVQGFFITTSYFTKNAIKEAKKSPKRLHTWDMRKLIDRIIELKIGMTPFEREIRTINRAYWDKFIEE